METAVNAKLIVANENLVRMLLEFEPMSLFLQVNKN